MHIPDGYIGPIMSLGSALVTVPVWSIAVKRVQKILSNRTVPLMAIFAAFSFTIMMFNVPVPGGTTAHGVGGTLAAVVLGPAAAIVTVSMALIIQALFFGDGGILAIFINCLNMAIILPLVGYGVYRLIAGRSPILSNRRVWAAGIGAYVGITASALAVGIELGLQPLLFSNAGMPLYSPYGLAQAIPAMLISHIFGASAVEAIITSLGVAYMQKRYPEYLTSLRSVFADPRWCCPPRRTASSRSGWPSPTAPTWSASSPGSPPQTETIKLGAAIMQVPARPPAAAAMAGRDDRHALRRALHLRLRPLRARRSPRAGTASPTRSPGAAPASTSRSCARSSPARARSSTRASTTSCRCPAARARR